MQQPMLKPTHLTSVCFTPDHPFVLERDALLTLICVPQTTT